MGQRRSINIGGQSHGAQPIPAASFKNGMLASSAVYGSPVRPDAPISMDEQCTALFATIEALCREAGGSLDDVIHVSIKLKHPDDREVLNQHWLRTFPDPASRPARHVDSEPLDHGERLVAAEFLAMIDQ
jgi:2-iminobutanoate/2-iminopropanoate deaminase